MSDFTIPQLAKLFGPKLPGDWKHIHHVDGHGIHTDYLETPDGDDSGENPVIAAALLRDAARREIRLPLKIERSNGGYSVGRTMLVNGQPNRDIQQFDTDTEAYAYAWRIGSGQEDK